MSRSTRAPFHYMTSSASPGAGKRHTSRSIRRLVRAAIDAVGSAFDFAHPLDRTRGRAGSRDGDWGWSLFGDGRVRARTEPWRTRMTRK